MKYFFFGQVLRRPEDGKLRITAGDDIVVAGGSKEEHAEAREIMERFAEGVKMDGPHHAQEILKEAIRRVKG